MDRLLQYHRLTVAMTPAECDAWILAHVYTPRVSCLGFDTEFKPVFTTAPLVQQTPPTPQLALIQLATCDAVLLYPVYAQAITTWSPHMVRLLGDAAIRKFAVDSRGDEAALREVGILPRGLEDVQAVYMERTHAGARRGMRTMATELLNVELEKSKSMSTSSWHSTPLTIKQIHYAACDAIISLALAQALEMAPRAPVDLPRLLHAAPSLPALNWGKPRTKLLKTSVSQLLNYDHDQRAWDVSALLMHPLFLRLLAHREEVVAAACTAKHLCHVSADGATLLRGAQKS